MLEKLAGIAARYDEIERLMSDSAVASDYTKVAELNKERSFDHNQTNPDR